MGGGAGSGSGAAPYNDQAMTSLSSSSLQSFSKQTNRPREKPLPPQGFKNIGNTCYANAALQCLLSTALSHALLDPNTAVIFKRYSSNSNLLAMGSGSVDSDEEEVSRDEDQLLNISASDFVDPLAITTTVNVDFICVNDDASSTRAAQYSSHNHSCQTDDKKTEKRQLREERRRAKERQFSRETCSWLTGQLTDITLKYTAGPTHPLTSEQDVSGSLPWSLFNSSLKQQSPTGVVDPGAITRNVSKLSPCLQPYRQEDAHEFLRALLSTLIMDGQNRQLSSLFDGLLESAVTCQTCRHKSVTRDRYMDLSLDISNEEILDLTDALRHFTKTESLDSKNKVECGRCKTKRVVSKGLRLATAPTILVCHMKRFAYDCYGRTKRLSKYVKYPLRLEIGDFMSRANRGKPPPYELVGVLVHSGTSCDCGHYLAYVKSGNDWYKANDAIITKVDVENVLDQRAYILIYEVEGMRAEHGFHDFERYHEKPFTRQTSGNKLSHSDHGVPRTSSLESWDPQMDDDKSVEQIPNSSTVKTSLSHNPTTRKQASPKLPTRQQQSSAAASLFSLFGYCGSDCAVDAVKDGIWRDLCNVGSTMDASPTPGKEDYTEQSKLKSVLRSSNENATNGTSSTPFGCIYKPVSVSTSCHEPSNVDSPPNSCSEHVGNHFKKHPSSRVSPHSDAGVSNISVSALADRLSNRDVYLDVKEKEAARCRRKVSCSGNNENGTKKAIDKNFNTISDTDEENSIDSSKHKHLGTSGQQRRSKSLSRLSKSFKKLPHGWDGKDCPKTKKASGYDTSASLRKKDGSLPPLPQRGGSVSTSPIPEES